MRAQLLCRFRSGVTQTFEVEGAESVIGRDPGIGVSVPMEGVSRRHARILFDGKSHWVEDLGSTNGTLVNGQALRKEKLYHLDVVSLGKRVDMIFVLKDETTQVVKKLGVTRAALHPEAADAQPHDLAVGEVTLGRSSACNITAESKAVSKVHARILRSTDQLLLEDLGSSNGTFVNRERVMTAILRNGDVIALGGVETYRVAIEMGEITSASGTSYAAIAPPAAEDAERPRFSPEWRTRFEWDSAEYRAIADVQRLVAEQQRPGGPRAAAPPAAQGTEKTTVRPPKPQPAAPAAAPPPTAGARPAPAPPAALRPPAAQPVAPRPTPAPKAAEPATPPAPTASPAPVAAAPAKAAPAPPPPAATEASALPAPAEAPAPPAAAPAPRAAAPTPAGRVLEVHFTAPGFDLVAVETGAHDLGRAKEAALRVDNPTVSRQHARIIISDDRSIVYVQDRGGANGTRLNGTLVEQLKSVQDGDTIAVGQVELKVALKRG